MLKNKIPFNVIRKSESQFLRERGSGRGRMPQNQPHDKVEIHLQRHWGCLPYPTHKAGTLTTSFFSLWSLSQRWRLVDCLIREMPFIQSALGGILWMVWYGASFLKFLFLPPFLPLLLPSLSPPTLPASFSCSFLSNMKYWLLSVLAAFPSSSLHSCLSPASTPQVGYKNNRLTVNI